MTSSKHKEGSVVDIRNDLVAVAPYITRLVEIGSEFRRNSDSWSHYKNREDYHYIHEIPFEHRGKVELIYSEGRQLANDMSGMLRDINFDFSDYPTLTAIIDKLESCWGLNHYDSTIPHTALKICDEQKIDLWAVRQMARLYTEQESLLAAIRVTLRILKTTDLFKLENGIPLMKQEANISLSGVSGSSININSAHASATTTVYNEPAIFADLVKHIESQNLMQDEKKALIENVQTLAVSHKGGDYKTAYKDFIGNVANHLSIIATFFPKLAELL